ncbi:hypothetical protein SKAU_G00028110 [Synaphobranchus kaupii]|uniref:Uncharacterized protein n=1 Tax=Synaphobranchus kaupii TaxID=118154 RepID=A0A9Q1JDT6_SYNKA|nr:hypothetical protein SKAU_G00028110 [Synaphobranchus kaupii]
MKVVKDISSRRFLPISVIFAVGKRTFSVWRPSGLDFCVAVVGARGVNAHRHPYVTEAPWLAELLHRSTAPCLNYNWINGICEKKITELTSNLL